MRHLFLALGFLLVSWTASAQNPLPSPIPPHPRLIVSGTDWDRLREQVVNDPFSAKLYAKLEANAQQILPLPPTERFMEGRRMLSASRLVLERVTLLAMMSRISGDPDYTDRAIRELRCAARYSDWHPDHYLDTAEMSLAVAIGYDWLYDALSPEDRAEIETALLEKGLNTSIDPKGKHSGWVTATNNWNQVCHSGMTAAAIAIADLHPDIAATVINRSIKNLPLAGKAYAPEGVYPEGPMYWEYGTSFHVLLVAALDRFCGHAHGLDALPGFAQSPVFMAEVTSPTGPYFCFSDARESRGFNIPLFWFARRYGHAEWVQPEMAQLDPFLKNYGTAPKKGNEGYRLLPFALLWRDPTLADSTIQAPLQWMGRGENPLAVHRSAADKTASYVAIKGGSPSVNHGHMDAGSFILEADGIRWGLDLGMEPYNRIETMGYSLWDRTQNGQRWGLFRLGPDGHNILRFNGARQNVSGHASIVRFQGEGSQGGTVIDLSPLYAGEAASVHRGVRLLPSRAVLIQDEWTAKDQPVDVAWQFLTRAQAVVRNGAVELRQNGKTLTLQILEPAQATVEVKPAKELQQPVDSDNPGVSRIAIKTHTGAKENGKFRILAIPGSCKPRPEAPKTEALESWPSAL